MRTSSVSGTPSPDTKARSNVLAAVRRRLWHLWNAGSVLCCLMMSVTPKTTKRSEAGTRAIKGQEKCPGSRTRGARTCGQPQGAFSESHTLKTPRGPARNQAQAERTAVGLGLDDVEVEEEDVEDVDAGGGRYSPQRLDAGPKTTQGYRWQSLSRNACKCWHIY